MLPLGYWDSLYYALVAEIRQLHNDLQNRFGFGCENGTTPLHNGGPDGTSNQPVTAIDLASMLETAWYTLMDNRLVATLDDAVRMRRIRENAAKELANGRTKPTTDGKYYVGDGTEQPPALYGLMDVNELTPEAIISLLWEVHAPEIDRACCENFEDESMLTAYRAELHSKRVAEGLAASTPLPSASMCTCHRACVCRLKCDKDADTCTCRNRVQIYHLVQEQENTKAAVYSEYVKQDLSLPNQFLGAATNTLAQMQIAAMAQPDPVIVRACYDVNEANNTRERQVVSRSRQRANTNNSELAYVPGQSTPHRTRGPKEVFPLDFYGGYSPQRYPKLRPQAPTPSSKQDQPEHGSPNKSSSKSKPKRKPVPAPLLKYMPADKQQQQKQQEQSYRYENSSSQAPAQHRQNPKPPSSSEHNVQTFAQVGGVTYPAIPKSQSQSLFTQSFPVSGAGNPRENTNEKVQKKVDPVYKQAATQADKRDPAQDYASLLSRHPSAIEHGATEPFPNLTRSVTSSPPKKSNPSTNILPTLKSLNKNILDKPQPPLPQPDFIAPRPAVKQRYVSAGGNARLEDRAEIPGPAFAVSVATRSGATMSKEEVDAKMSDPEWVRETFGESAVAGMSGRSSEESEKMRRSNESERERERAEKRDRTSSGASGRVAKLKRVFSRKNSQSEADQ